MKLKPTFKGALWAIVAGAFAFFCLCNQANNPTPRVVNPLDLLPADDEVPGWIAAISSNCFEGVANDTNKLFEIFDGPGVPFIQNGWVNGVFKGYVEKNSFAVQDTIALCVQIFNQSTHAHALVIYQEEAFGEESDTILHNLGDTARMDTSLTYIRLMMVSKNYFIRLILAKRDPTKDPIFKQALIDFGSAIVRRINAALK